MKKRIYITGSRGLVGSRFLELLPRTYQTFTLEIDELDITDKKALKDFFTKTKPDVVIHFAAYTKVSEAENQRGDRKGLCWKVNVEGVRNLVESADPNKTHFIHISTDYVFPGSKEDPGPYSEDHGREKDSSKLTWYGFTKAEGERIIFDKLGDKATIFRIIYPVRAKFDKKLDYLRKPLSLYDQGKLYPMFSNQQVSITFIDEVYKAIKKIMDNNITGVFHASSRDTSTPFELVSYMLEKVREVKDVVRSQTLEEFIEKTGSSSVRYPPFGGLRVEQTEKKLGMRFSTWREIIDQLVSQGMG